MAVPSTKLSRPPPPPLPPRVTFQLTPTSKKMSITQTFYLAHKARGKLSAEASRQDHNLRLLVGHANLLDSLMIHLSEAEAEQERWYNNTVQRNEPEWTEPENESEEYGSLATDYESDTESESEDEDDFEIPGFSRTTDHRFLPRHEAVVGVSEVDEDYDEDDTEDDEIYDDDEVDADGMFLLTRSTSHRPPSLCSDCSEDEDEDSNPPSPPQPSPMSAKDELHAASHGYFDSPPQKRLPLHHDPAESLFDDRLLPTMIDSF